MKMLSLIRKFKNVSLVFSASDSLILRQIEKSVDFSKGNIVTIICNGKLFWSRIDYILRNLIHTYKSQSFKAQLKSVVL